LRSSSSLSSPATVGQLRLTRIRRAFEAAGLAVSSGYAAIDAGTFPSTVPAGGRARAVPTHELDAVVRARLADAADNDLKVLVSAMLPTRTSADPIGAVRQITDQTVAHIAARQSA
jgi:predicted DNA-binding transcriptional regulator AlpA